MPASLRLLAAPLRHATLRVSLSRCTTPRALLAAASSINNPRFYVTSPLTPDPDAKPAAADLPVKPAHDNLPFAAPSNKDETKGELGQVDMPDMGRVEDKSSEAAEFQVRIPTAPDTYRSSETSPDAPSEPVAHTPEVATASHPSTYHGGGPTLNKAGQDGDVVVDPLGEGEGDSKQKKAATSQPEKDGKSDESASSEKDKERGEKSYKYEWKDRGLDDEEKRGLYLLGGMLVGGYVLSTVTQPGYLRRKN
ncbi:hypothetical protein JCM10908_004494 [Rhodotorula pacifica]|uniref:uncharacterized protein n=1 Tax=Rhodotorula pacifica TaxID=1495444 RepID=UPI00317195BD